MWGQDGTLWHPCLYVYVKVGVRITLRLEVYRQSVRLGEKPPENHDQYFFNWILAVIVIMEDPLWREDEFISYYYAWPFIKCTFLTLARYWTFFLCTSHKSSVSTGFTEQIMPTLRICSLLVCQNQSQSYVTTDGQPATLSWNKAPIWGLRPGRYYCMTVVGLLMWGALSDERTGLLFARVTVSSKVCCQYVQFTSYMLLNVYTYTRPLWVQAPYSRSCHSH
jgi:hypothetical protein